MIVTFIGQMCPNSWSCLSAAMSVSFPLFFSFSFPFLFPQRSIFSLISGGSANLLPVFLAFRLYSTGTGKVMDLLPTSAELTVGKDNNHFDDGL